MSTTEQDLEHKAQASAEQSGSGPASESAAASKGAEGSASAGSREATLENDLRALNDKHVRLFAEFENYRRRTAKENIELVATANASLLTKLTEVIDNFDRAFDPKYKGVSPEDFEKGIKLIHQRFRQLLEDEGLDAIDPQGQEFDPNLHEALLQQPSAEVPEGRVITVVQKGWKLKGKILKHARVVVSTGNAA